MATTLTRDANRAPAGAPATRPWQLPHYLAGLGILSVVWGAVTVIPWLLDGPEPVTGYARSGSGSWYAARIYEAVALLLSAGVATVVIRQCRRERRLTFDAKFCIAWFLMFWVDPVINMVAPIWMYSSNWVNLSAWCGHMPLVLNADCGRIPEPVLFMWPLYTFGFLAFVMIANAGMRAAKRRWPHLSTAKLVGLAAIGGMLLDLALELPMYHLHLWGFPGAPGELALMGGTNRYPLVQVVFGALVFSPCALLRYCKNDRGETVTERGLETLSPRGRAVVSTMATHGLVFIIAMVVTIGSVAYGMYSDPYPRMPAHLVNGMCDAPGITGTAYGACPGSPEEGRWDLKIGHLEGTQR